jgi:hypothetical protein
METQNITIEERLKTIYNNDVAVLDYLADMPDRNLLKQLQRFINYGNNEPNCILHKGILGYTLLLYKAPFGLNTGDNNLTLYFHSRLSALCVYFKQDDNAQSDFLG